MGYTETVCGASSAPSGESKRPDSPADLSGGKSRTRMIEQAGISEQGGVRHRNEDYLLCREPDAPEIRRRKGSLFIVADGVGGSSGGDVASREAAHALMDEYYANSKGPEKAMRDALHRANLHVYDLGLRKARASRMETTVAALALVGGQAIIGHVGDSRVYRVREAGGIISLTTDHSEVMEMVRMNLIRPEQARSHPRRNVITRSVGAHSFLRVDIRVEAVEPGDTFILCTDGLWEPVSDGEIAFKVLSHAPGEACRALADLAIERGTTDNVTVQIVKVIAAEAPNAAGSGPNAHGGWLRSLMARFGQAGETSSEKGE